MARLIDGDALINTLQELFDKREKEQVFTGSRGSCVTWNDAIYHIKSAPTVDAVAVVHATLEDMGLAEDDREWVCSNCKAEFTLCVCGKDRIGYIKHCPYCGAMIIGEHKGGDE